MSKTRDALRHQIFQPRNWGHGSKGKPLPEPWWGLDTERDANSGDFVCGWISDAKRSERFESFRDLKPGTYWIWNLAYDIEGMIRDLGKEEGWAMKEDGTPFDLLGARCVYFHGKRFEWKDDGGRRIFLEASSFFNRISLKEAALTLCVCKCESCKRHKKEPKEFKHCGEGEWNCPTKDPVDASKMSVAKYKRDAHYRKLVDEYCAKDARIAYRLMDYLRVGFRELRIEMAGTPGSTSKRGLADVPQFPPVIWSTHRPFLEAYCGGRFEVVRRGVFHDALQYDKISAYPWALARCPMLTSTAYHRFAKRLSDESLYGAYEISFKTDEYFGIMPTWRGSTRVYSRGEERGWICKPELEWLQSRGHDYTVHRGVEVFDPNAHDGWKRLVEPVFHIKQTNKGKPVGLGAKVNVNSMYGNLIQLILRGGKWVPIEEAENPVDFAGLLALEKGPKAYEAGQFYAPIYSSTLTSMVRVDLLNTARKIGEDDVVAFHTDSILLKDGATLAEGKELGDWELQKRAGELIILKSGQYAIGDDVKGRGFSKRKLNPESEDEIAIRQKVDLWASEHTRRSRVGVKTAGGDWRNVSVIRNKQVANNISWEIKRKWLGEFSMRLLERKSFLDSEALYRVAK